MRKAKFLAGCFVSMLLVTSCAHVSDGPKSYFDGLVLDQQYRLASAKSHLSKKAVIDGVESLAEFVPDSAGWSDELEIFRQLSIMDRAAFRTSYKVEDGLKDSRSNLTVRRYSTLADIPVPRVEFYYLRQFEQIKKIEAIYQQNNLLYTTTRKLVLEFDDEGGQLILSRYSVKGVQQMLFGSPVQFSIESRITD